MSLKCKIFWLTNFFFKKAFNIIQRSEARFRMNALIKQSDFERFANEVNNLTLNDIEDAVNLVFRDPRAKYNQTLYRLISKVQSSSANVQGSMAALKHRRNDLRAYIVHFGAPHFFITINPADIHAPLVLKIGGVNVTSELLGHNYQFRAKFLKENPVIQAQYFDLIIKSFIKFLLGYDKKKSKNGVLGYIKAYYGMVETQDRGSLHLHMMAWVVGGTNPSELKEKLKLHDFKVKLLKYLDSVIHCDFEGLLKTKSNAKTNDFDGKKDIRVYEPYKLEIIENDDEYDNVSHGVIYEKLLNEEETANESDIHPCCKSIDYITKNMKVKKNLAIFLRDVYDVAQDSAIHSCRPSCFKYNASRGGSLDCRHGFEKNVGKALQKFSMIDTDGNINLKRLEAFVNEFNWVFSAGIRCNHDISFIARCISSSLACVYYVTNYITKSGLSSYNSMLFSLMAFQKLQKYEKEPTDSLQKTKKLLFGCYNAAANNTEYSGALVCNMLNMNGKNGTYYSSHNTRVLKLFSCLAELEGNVYDNLVDVREIFSKQPIIDVCRNDYELRPLRLNKESLYEFMCYYKKQKIVKRKKPINSYRLLEKHEQFDSHEIVKLKESQVPIIICKSIPRKNDLDRSDEYAKIILLLFKPWRTLNDLLDKDCVLYNENSIWKQNLENFLKKALKPILRFIDNLECLNKSKDDAEEEKKCLKKSFQIKSQRICDNSDIDDDENNVEDENDVLQYNDDEDQLMLIKANTDILSAVCNEKLNTPYITTANKIISSLDKSTTQPSNNKSSNTFLVNMEKNDEIKIKNWKTIYDNVNKDDPSNDPFELSDTFLDNTVIENNEKSKTTHRQSISENEIKQTEKVSFNDIIDKFSLNEQQQKAFLLFVSSVFNEEEDQKLIYMTGEGGTGKSRVIMAIREYFESNGAKNKLLISAPTVRIFSRIFFKMTLKFILINIRGLLLH